MALAFDGVNDEGSAANAFSGLTGDTRSWAAWVNYRSQPAGTEIIEYLAEAVPAVENSEFGISARVPVTAGWRIAISSGHGTTPGLWTYAVDLSLNTWYHICLTYDQALTTNDAVIYVDGVAVSVTESATPNGALPGGMDSTSVGFRNSANYGDFIIQERGWWSSILTATDALTLSKGYCPLFVSRSTLQHYDSFKNATSPSQEIIQRQGLTISGATAAAHKTGIIYPSGMVMATVRAPADISRRAGQGHNRSY